MKPKITKEQAIKAIEGTGGIVKQIADKLNVTRISVYNYINRYDLQDLIDQERESLIDTAETKLVQNINNNDNTAIIFFLKTQGKKRGYVERQEVTGRDGGDFMQNIGLSESTIDAVVKAFEQQAMRNE